MQISVQFCQKGVRTPIYVFEHIFFECDEFSSNPIGFSHAKPIAHEKFHI